MGRGRTRSEERKRSEDQQEEALHARALLATGAQRSEKSGFVRSARRNQRRASAGRSRQRSIIPRWKTWRRRQCPAEEPDARVARLAAAPVADERPGQHVVCLDARSRLACAAGALERLAEPDAVVDVEEGELEIRLDAVGDEEAVDRAHEPVLLAARPGRPAAWYRSPSVPTYCGSGDCSTACRSSSIASAESSTGRLDVCQRVERLHVAGERRERTPVFRLGRFQPSPGEVELAELRERPCRRLAPAAGGIDGQCHRLEGAVRLAEELQGVRHAGVRRDPGLQLCEPIERLECFPVPAELDECVTRRAVDDGGVRSESLSASGERKSLAEVVPRVRERGEADQCLNLRGILIERLLESGLRAGVSRGLARPASGVQLPQAERTSSLVAGAAAASSSC